MKKVFIIHGFQASAQSHWFPWLKQQLEAMNRTGFVGDFFI